MKRFAALFLLLLVPGVMFSVGKKSASEAEKEYVQNFSEEDIVKKNSYSKASTVTRTSNGKTTIKVKRFSGIEEVFVLSPKNQNVEITLSSTVESGALRVVVCDKDKIVYEFDVDEKDQTYKLPATSGRYYIKTVGKNCRYTLEIGYTAKKTELPSFEGTIL